MAALLPAHLRQRQTHDPIYIALLFARILSAIAASFLSPSSRDIVLEASETRTHKTYSAIQQLSSQLYPPSIPPLVQVTVREAPTFIYRRYIVTRKQDLA